MSEDDFDAFSDMLDAVCGLLSKGAYVPSDQNTALFFRAMVRHPLAEVRAGFDRHIADPQRGRFVPVPADILAQIENLVADDCRPGAEEAFAIALQSADERATVVWTREIREAWRVARAVFDAGDEVGARMAFRESYNRLVDAARANRLPAEWIESLGHDASKRALAIEKAVQAGYLPASSMPTIAGPAPVGLLELSQADGAPPELHEVLRNLRESIATRAAAPSADVVARERTEELKMALPDVEYEVPPNEILRRVAAGAPVRVAASAGTESGDAA